MRILLVEDSSTSVRMVEGLLAAEEQHDRQFDLVVAGTLADAKKALAHEPFDLILLDLTLPDSFGMATVDAIIAEAHDTGVVVLTGSSDESVGLEALKRGAQDFLVKDETYRKVLVRSIRYAYQRKVTEQEIKTAKELAELATQSKSRFVANLSHELRNPLNAIIGFSEMMAAGLHGELNPKYREYANDITKSARYLFGLIGTVLDMSKIEAEHIELSDDIIDVARLLDDVVGQARQHPSFKAGKTIEISPMDILPPLRADRIKIQQVLLNLVSNAVKFTGPNGRITIGAHRDPKGALVIVIDDDGIGIPADQLALVLEPFHRTTISRSEGIEGTGLGLPIVKSLVEAHGGTMTLASMENRGTTVTVTFPPNRMVMD